MKKINLILLTFSILFMYSCGEEASDVKKEVETKVEEVKEVVKEEVKKVEETTSEASSIGVGPITKLELSETLDEAMVEKGKEIYKANCTACHKMKKRSVGPALDGVTIRRTPEWVMNMILNPDEMVVKDPTAKALLAEYLAPMANQSLSEEEARAILEFFRSRDKK